MSELEQAALILEGELNRTRAERDDLLKAAKALLDDEPLSYVSPARYLLHVAIAKAEGRDE